MRRTAETLPWRDVSRALAVEFGAVGAALPALGGCLQSIGQLACLRIDAALAPALTLKPRAPRYLLLLSVDGETLVSRRGRQLRLQAGEALMLAPDSWSGIDASQPGRRYLVAFDEALLRAAMAELDLFGDLNCDRRGAVELSAASGLLADALHRQQAGGGASDLILACYDRILLLSVVEAFFAAPVAQRTALSDPAAERRCLAAVKRYIRANLTGDLQVEAMADTLGVSRRQLYYLFDRMLGVTPLEYIRRLKVQAIYQELARGDRRTNITDIALKYGFSNPGRFSQHYKRYIGELPSQTLKQTLRG